MKRLQKGDLVKFRPETRVRFEYGIAAEEIGTVVDVEPHPPRMGPTYMVSVKFRDDLTLPLIHSSEYLLSTSP